MWAQIIKMRVKPGKEDQIDALFDQLQESEQPGSGLIRSTMMRDQNDPSLIYAMPVFESEEAARKRENDPARQESLKGVFEMMRDIFEAPEFIDLEVLREA